MADRTASARGEDDLSEGRGTVSEPTRSGLDVQATGRFLSGKRITIMALDAAEQSPASNAPPGNVDMRVEGRLG